MSEVHWNHQVGARQEKEDKNLSKTLWIVCQSLQFPAVEALNSCLNEFHSLKIRIGLCWYADSGLDLQPKLFSVKMWKHHSGCRLGGEIVKLDWVSSLFTCCSCRWHRRLCCDMSAGIDTHTCSAESHPPSRSLIWILDLKIYISSSWWIPYPLFFNLTPPVVLLVAFCGHTQNIFGPCIDRPRKVFWYESFT